VKNILKHILMAGIAAIMLYGCAANSGGKVQQANSMPTHPELDSQEMLVSCASCHRDVTPDIYKQWYDSRHGIGNVKCFQCHGTYENFRKIPAETSCASCHNEQFGHSVAGKKCWDCHPAHNFQGHM
jgi:hypothetical protein